MKQLIIIIGTIILGCLIFNMMAGDASDSLKNISLDVMERATEAFAHNASSFGAVLQDEISANAISLTQEILATIKETKEIIEQSGKTVIDGAAMIDELENRARDMKGKI